MILNKTAILLLLFSTVSVSAVYSESLTKFKITDYIPEKFEDFLLYIDGSGSFELRNRNDNASVRNSSVERDQYISSLVLNSSYLFETIEKRLRIDLDLNYELESNRSGSIDIRENSNYTLQKIILNSDSNIKKYGLRIHLDASSYFAQEIFHNFQVMGTYSKSIDDGELNFSMQSLDSNLVGDILTEINRNSNTYRKSKSSYEAYNFTAIVGVGWGHKYVGVYSATANYYIDLLKKNDLLIRNLSNAEMLELTKLIYEHRLEKHYSKRELRIKTFKAITEFLITIGIINQENFLPTFLLEDIWDYFPKDPRYFGFQVQVFYEGNTHLDEVENDIYTREYNTTNEYSYDINNSTLIDSTYSVDSSETVKSNSRRTLSGSKNMNLLFTYEKPLNFKWQFSSSLRYRVPFITNTISEMEEGDIREDLFDNSDLNFDNTLSFIPTTRTRADFMVNMVYQNRDFIRRAYVGRQPNGFYRDSKIKQKSFSILTEFTGTYRISIPTNLTVSMRNYYEHFSFTETAKKNTSSILSFSVGLSHYLY